MQPFNQTTEEPKWVGKFLVIYFYGGALLDLMYLAYTEPQKTAQMTDYLLFHPLILLGVIAFGFLTVIGAILSLPGVLADIIKDLS